MAQLNDDNPSIALASGLRARRAVLALTVTLPPVMAQTAHVPPVGSAERKEISDALRATVKIKLWYSSFISRSQRLGFFWVTVNPQSRC